MRDERPSVTHDMGLVCVTRVTLSASLRLDSLRSLGSALAPRDPHNVEGSGRPAPLELPKRDTRGALDVRESVALGKSGNGVSLVAGIVLRPRRRLPPAKRRLIRRGGVPDESKRRPFHSKSDAADGKDTTLRATEAVLRLAGRLPPPRRRPPDARDGLLQSIGPLPGLRTVLLQRGRRPDGSRSPLLARNSMLHAPKRRLLGPRTGPDGRMLEAFGPRAPALRARTPLVPRVERPARIPVGVLEGSGPPAPLDVSRVTGCESGAERAPRVEAERSAQGHPGNTNENNIVRDAGTFVTHERAPTSRVKLSRA